MSGDLIKAKLKATGIHLSISLIIFLGVLYLILVEWYPEPYFKVEGGIDGLTLMAIIDLILGPSLTFIIFSHLKPKKEIIFDLSIIAVLQISALVWGGAQVFSERPVAIVFWEDTFYTVTEDYFQKQNITVEELKKLDSHHPSIIYAEKAKDVIRLELMQQLHEQKIPPYAQYHLYQDYRQHLKEIFTYQIADFLLSPAIQNKLKQLKNQGEKEVYVLPVTAKYNNAVLIMDESGVVLGTEEF